MNEASAALALTAKADIKPVELSEREVKAVLMAANSDIPLSKKQICLLMVKQDSSWTMPAARKALAGMIAAGYLESEDYAPSKSGRAWLGKWGIPDGTYVEDPDAEVES